MSARVVVCGAGIAGISTAFHLAREGISDVVIVDPRPPLTLTSDKSTECYRNWWPSQPMVELMNRSIDLLDGYAAASGNAFGLNRRGYLYVTADTGTLETMTENAAAASGFGAGELRTHHRTESSYEADDPARGGADLFTNGDALLAHFPFLNSDVVGGLHARTAGWLSAQQFGMWMLEQALAAGVTLLSGSVVDVTAADRVESVTLADGSSIATDAFVNAAGPMLPDVGRMVGVELPVFSELHAKVTFRDYRVAVPRSAPMIIWNDPQRVAWDREEEEYLRSEGRQDLLAPLPGGCHARPEGGGDSPWMIGLWEYGAHEVAPTWPLPPDPMYPEMVIRGLARMVPDLAVYQNGLPESTVDGGYYTKTTENRPLAGPAGPDGSYVCGALSGFGIMAAAAVGELVAKYVSGAPLPDWARWFALDRYNDAAYVASLRILGDSGQL